MPHAYRHKRTRIYVEKGMGTRTRVRSTPGQPTNLFVTTARACFAQRSVLMKPNFSRISLGAVCIDRHRQPRNCPQSYVTRKKGSGEKKNAGVLIGAAGYRARTCPQLHSSLLPVWSVLRTRPTTAAVSASTLKPELPSPGKAGEGALRRMESCYFLFAVH